jgi:molecular chaperone HtpG
MIQTPDRLKKLLEQDQLLDGATTLLIHSCDQVLKWSKLPFFPDYTDHGYRHLSEVLATWANLITDASWPSLTSRDATVSILSVLFHDLGMHITEDGFLSLIDPTNTQILIPEVDAQSWPRCWEEFMSEAHRFDQRMLMQIFGDALPVSDPVRNPSMMTERDRRLIGEFLRRNHPRLAHEFAVFGFAGAGQRIRPPSEMPNYVLDLAGIVARSHGSDLRCFIPLLRRKYHARDYKGTHAVYLMALLRVADYLQIQASRAPELPLKLHTIPSTFSLREWKTHQAVTNVTRHDDDPESIYVQTAIEGPDVYLKLKDLFASLQHELDISWAVLGEIYGRFPDLSTLGLAIRRLRSDIEENKGAVSGDFVRERFSFEAAGADLLKLLAEPLYGWNANFGVRELIQNSVDAVLELHSVTPKPNLNALTSPQQSDVDVSLEGSVGHPYILRVTDKGIGMSSEVLRNYFLRAGASYRRSSEWQKAFADEGGHSRVLRSGRFGIGVLAAFILGDEISVMTRHCGEKLGLGFEARIETDPIDVRYVEMPVGTEIAIKLNTKSANQLIKVMMPSVEKRVAFGSLPNGLYLLEYPSLSLRLNDKVVPRTDTWPAANQDPLPAGWNRIRPSGFAEVQWIYDGEEVLACNGIAVARPSDYRVRAAWSFPEDAQLGPSLPTLSIFDPDGNLGLRLDRTSLTSSQLPFGEHLVKDIYRDIVAWCLAAHGVKDVSQLKLTGPDTVAHPAVGRQSERQLLFLEDGFTILTPKLALDQNLHTINRFHFLDDDVPLPRPSNGEGSMRMEMVPSVLRRARVVRQTIKEVRGRQRFGGYHIVGARIITFAEIGDWARRISRRYLRHLNSEPTIKGWASLTVGACRPSVIRLAPVAEGRRYGPIIVQQYLEKDASSSFPPSRITRALLEDVGATSIPYVLEQRQSLSGYAGLSRQVGFHARSINKTREVSRAKPARMRKTGAPDAFFL